ncbi:lipopolysaccharide biosynthesis protein [Pelomonas sp. Root1237]|uniref:lipopolysaccharide biosynthesis protein n=1 Tax=Pelomonas sp. Root1237 TaxID=1736434 RepID=UPI0006F39010|nr:oligosaccharide flippase family protein [Pelomonas sp. Root1237]KQV86545.1 hypothetical protein ASC91_22190 [Pelomonas sp. Root1237]
MTARASFWSDVRWQAIGNTSAQALGVLGMPLLTRLYTPADFAAQSVFLQFAMFFSGLMTWRYEYFVQLPRRDSDALALLRLTLLLAVAGCVLLTPLTWLSAPLLSMDPGQTHWLWLSPMTAALISLSLAHQHWTQRKGLFKLSGMGEVLAKLAYIGTGVLATLCGLATLGLIATIAAGAAAKLVLHLLAGRADRHIAAKAGGASSAIQAARTHARHAGSMFGSHLLGTVTGLVTILFIGQFYGSIDLGQYSLVAATIFLPAGLIGSAIGQVYYQRAAALWSRGESFAPLWRQTFARLSAIGVLAYALIALLSPWAYPFIFGDAWEAAGRYAVWMSIAAFFSFVSAPMDRSSLVVGRLHYLPIWHAARALTTLCALALAWRCALSFDAFMALHAAQMSVLYVVDLLAERSFARLCPPDMALSPVALAAQ